MQSRDSIFQVFSCMMQLCCVPSFNWIFIEMKCKNSRIQSSFPWLRWIKTKQLEITQTKPKQKINVVKFPTGADLLVVLRDGVASDVASYMHQLHPMPLTFHNLASRCWICPIWKLYLFQFTEKYGALSSIAMNNELNNFCNSSQIFRIKQFSHSVDVHGAIPDKTGILYALFCSSICAQLWR